MLKFIVRIENVEQFETLLLASKSIGLTPSVEVEAIDVPQPRRKSQARKASTKKRKGKPKRYPAKMSVKTVPLNSKSVPPKAFKAHAALVAEFKGEPFEKRLAKAALIRRLKTPHVSGYVTTLMDKGGMVAAG